MADEPRAGATDLLLVASLLATDGIYFVMGRVFQDYLPADLASLYVQVVAALEVGLFALLRGRLEWGVLRRYLGLFAAVGALVGVSSALVYVAVSYLDPGTAAMLSQTSVVFGVVLGVAWLGDRLNRWQVAGAVLALIGVALITFQPGKYLSVGALLVLASSALYALHAALVKRHGEGIPFLSFFTFRLASASLFLLLITSARGSLSWPSLPAWGLLLFTSTVGVVFNRALYYAILNCVSLSVHSVILAATPVSAVTWGALLLRTTPSARELLGGVVVIAGVLLTTLGRRSTQMSAG